MKCPYCKKEINFEEIKEVERKNREKKKKDKVKQILYKIKKGECSISNLQKQTGIKRSTLNYYLKILEKGEFIVRKRIEKEFTGRPTLISITIKGKGFLRNQYTNKRIYVPKGQTLFNPQYMINPELYKIKGEKEWMNYRMHQSYF